MRESCHVTDDVIIGNFSVTINRTEQEGEAGGHFGLTSKFQTLITRLSVNISSRPFSI